MSIGDNIKNLRLKHGLEQWQIAEIAGVTNKAVSSWELGNSIPRMGAIEKIAMHFGIRKSDIIEETNTPSKTVVLDDISFAMHSEFSQMSDEEKQEILRLARMINNKK